VSGVDEFDDLDASQDGTVFRDVIMLALMGFMVIVVILLPHLNPPENAADIEPPGNLIVEVRWADGLDADVDLWVKAPGERSIGYSNQSGRIFNLLRDDLGKKDDSTGLNYEIAFSRGTPRGEYTVNLHLYNCRRAADLPVTATVAVKMKRVSDGKTTELLIREARLRRVDEESTVARFTLDEHGRLVPDSINALPRKLRRMG
jgi:hypothetical protein